MLEIFAILASILSLATAFISVFAVIKFRQKVREMERTLVSKYENLPPSADVEDPEGQRHALPEGKDEDDGDQ